MLVPITWLKEYTDVPDSLEEYCERMIMSGSNLEGVHSYGQGIEKVVLGKITAIEPHPDAEKLVVCQVNIGEKEDLHIVTGAPNVFVGALVPVALHGSKIPGPLHGQPKKEGGELIQRGSLRGVLSDGMLCSLEELGFEDKVVPVAHREGIWILNHTVEEENLGSDFVKMMGLANQVVDFEITPNRPDCLSLLGMARETAATFQVPMRYPNTALRTTEGDSGDYVQVEIKKPDLCRRYLARVVTDVKVKPSPWWMQKRLMLAGMRPINNIVDITNYVMLEYGEPIHAFDIRQIEGKKIVVDTADPQETFTTLDGIQRIMPPRTLMIKDGNRSIGIAGIMGGLNSEIVEDTKTILVEAANFNGDAIRTSSKKMGLRTEASARFEKGIDPNLCGVAAERVVQLIEELSAGKALAKPVDVYPSPMMPTSCMVRASRVQKIMGIHISPETIRETLERLEMVVEDRKDFFLVTPPTVRQDLVKEIDYVEEVARIYGFDRLPVTVPKGNSAASKTRERMLQDLAKETLCALGVYEAQTYSFVSQKTADLMRIPPSGEERDFVQLINPLGEENSVMRTMLLPNIMEVLGRNYNRNREQVRIFELGNIFRKTGGLEEGLPLEKVSLAMGVYGKEESFYTLKGMFIKLLEKLGVTDITFQANETIERYHPGRCGDIFLKGKPVGTLGEIHPEVVGNYELDTRVFGLEVDFQKVMEAAETMRYFTPLAKYPSISRDIALLVEEDVTVGRMEQVIRETGTELLEQVELFDVYRGNQVEPGKKSCAFTLVYRGKERTLKEEEVGLVHNEVLKALKEKTGAMLREI
jgi:phenylalanyl-tRNA synthetase beta chain